MITGFIIDGQRWNLKEQEEDEVIQATPQVMRNETEIRMPVELAETIKELNDDAIESGRMTRIDTKARLSMVECPAILSIDFLVQIRFLPVSTLFLTRQRKRLSVSEEGKGREEIVKIVQGKMEQDKLIEKKGFMSFMQKPQQ